MSEDEVGNINTGTEMEMEEKSGKKCWSRPLSKESLLPPGFLPGAGAFDVAVSGAPSANCACCAALRAAEAAHPAGAGGGNRAVLATLDSAGDAMGFWVGNTEDAEPRTHVLVSVASLRELGCDRGIGIEALSELARRNKLTYSACVAAGTHHADGGGASSSTAAAPCRHVITFTVHLSLVFFDSRQTAEEASSQRWLRRLLSTFTTRLAAQSRGSVEQHEIDCMRNAAQRLGMSMREDAGLNAFLYMPLLPNQAQSLASKFRLEHVLDSILQSSYSTPQSCGDAAVDLSPSADVKVEKGHLDSKGKGPADDKGKGPATSSCSLHRRVGLAVDRLPEDALVNMLELLEPLQLDIVSLVCKSMHAAAHICIPGLKLQLYKHQRRAMEWMMLRERPARTVVWNPLVTKFTTANGTDYFLASKATGAALTLDSHTNTEVEDIRGGLLCDEPGMGKTITVLALILKTRRPLADRKLPPATWVGEASGSHRTFPHTAKSEQKVKLNNQEHQMSIDCCEAAVLPPTLSNKRFRFFLAAPDGDACQSGFTWSHTSLIPATPRAATQASPARLRSDSSAMSASLAVSEMGSSGGLRRSRRSSGSLSTPLLRRSCPSLQGDNNGMSSLHVSSSTLIVVPATLIDHWKFQITQHTRDGVLSVLAVNKPSEMLPAALMAKYDVVLTTFDVLSKEWAIASPSPGSDRWYKLHGTVGRGTQSWRFSPGDYKGVGADAQSRASSSSLHAAESSELLLVRWQRVILDEGHVMGASCDTNRALMLASIVAGARWICTGTPAPSTPAAELQHMYGLITALAVQPYTNPDTWRSLIHAPFESQNAMAWMRLHVLLDRVMIRAVKADMVRLGEIPTCTTSTTELELSRPEKKAYNCLLTVIKRNIVLAECGGSRVDSLLYAKNRKYALEAINNARKACCVTGQFNLEIVRAHLEECILDMRRGHSLHEPHCECNGSYFDVPSLKQMFVTTRSGNCRLLEDTSRVVLEHQIRHVEDAFAGVGGSGGMRTVLNTHDGHIKCDKCERLSVFPFITPCAHMICMDCVCANNQKATSECPVCQQRYSSGRFAHFQPSVENPRMEWNADWIETVSTKVALLLTRLRANGFFHKLQVNEMWWHDVVVRRVVHSTAQMRSNPASATSQAMERAGKYSRKIGKCIVFSNFIEAIDNVSNSLSEALSGAGIFMRFTANMKGGAQERIAALKLFRDDPNISILLLDGVGAVGLDLSFVSHIFLLDPIWDKSLEDQVISRAHRLGAKQAITVEKLIATGTVEQMMEQLAREHDTHVSKSSSAADAASAGAGEERDVGQGASSGDEKELTRQRGDEIKRQRETTKIQNILIGLRALPYDPDAERAREEMVDFVRTFETNDSGNHFPNQPKEDRCMAPSGFIAADSFQGSKQGFVFKNGQHGVGYYLDISASHVGVATGQEDVDRSAKRVRFSD